MADFSVAGRQFRTKADYNAALQDQAQIEAIKAKINMQQPGEVIGLLQDLSVGKYHMKTLVGRDFIEEINELAEKYIKQGYTKDSKIKLSKQKKLTAKTNKGSNQKNNKVNGTKQDKRSLEDYDENMQKEIKAVLKKNEQRRKLIVALCSVIALACFGYYGVYYYFAEKTQSDYDELNDLRGSTILSSGTPDVTIHYTNPDEEDIELEVLEEYATLYNKNKRLIGWITIDGTNIDYPVMQTTNNEYYLDHNYNQENDRNGSIFLDKDCDIVHRNTNLIIYGHNMKSGKMFGTLSKYSSKSFYDEHPTFQFDTIYEKGTYQVMYAFRSRIYNEDEIVFKYYQFIDAVSEKEFISNLQEMEAIALYDTGVTASYGDELLTLSTCDNSETAGRFVVVAKKIE
ncbi:MAG: class B sortase [Lachnospiraceae bacterium]|nr:class B sortase [Lachnospiraceae bacterium]